MTKKELLLCFEVVRDRIPYRKSWNKERLAELLHKGLTSKTQVSEPSKRRKLQRPKTLKSLSKKIVNSYPKTVINAIIAEHEFDECVKVWRRDSPFSPTTFISNGDTVTWFSAPEYNNETVSYIFSFLDVHHLITNCRIKVCKDGFPQRGVYQKAWLDVAKGNTTKLKISHVEDLVDKQSDSIARETFSKDVELCMHRLGYVTEANFCKLIREFYEAEDDPGIDVSDRCQRRLNLRQWLLDDVNFHTFPPYGSYIRGIPNIMFQGLLTNIERRLQLFPYVKSGIYNVRSLGSLEAENLFGEFQDLDPKGSGVIKAEEVPFALESACQLLKTRLTPDKPFHMTLSRAKVYPIHDLMEECGLENPRPFLYPEFTTCINIRNHMFDVKTRAKRKAQRKLVGIAEPDAAARGVAPVRQHHKCDESKILPHKRFGIDLL